MSIGETLSRLLLKRLVDDVFTIGGVESLDALIDFLLRCGQVEEPRLTAALGKAMQRAWRALEAALIGEPSLDHSQTGLTPRAAQDLRRYLTRIFAELTHHGVSDRMTALAVAKALRRQCLDDLRCARVAGGLAGCLDHEEWARSHEVFVRFASNQGQRDTRRRTEGQFLLNLEQQGCVGLMRLLTGAGGLPLLLTTARAFLCQELAQVLYFCLQECPEQTPDNCTRILEILHELSSPRFSLGRASIPFAIPIERTTPVHWSRLESDPVPERQSHVARPLFPERSQRTRKRATPRHASWALAALLTIAAALLVVLPGWLIVEYFHGHDGERQRTAALRHQQIREQRRRLEDERQRWIEAQQRIVREEEARQQALQRQRQVEEHRRQVEAEEERRRAEERAVEQRREQQRRIEEERRTRLREERKQREQARLALEDGLTHSALRKDREALTALGEALRLDPKLRGAWRERGVVRRRMGDSAGALVDFHEAVRRDPQDVRAWFQCGELHAERDEHRQAIDAFTVVLRLDPTNAAAYRQRGLCFSRSEDLDKALADQTKAIALAPDDPWSYYHRANLHRLRNDLGRAFDDYTSAIEHDNDRGLACAHRGRGMISLHWQKYDQTIKDLKSALRLDPADRAARRARCLAYLRIGEWTSALLDANELIEHNSQDLGAYKMRGQAYLGLRDCASAHEDFSRVLRKDRDAETFYLRAQAKVQLGDIQEAIFDCNDATAINPHLACAFHLRGKLNLHEGYRISGLADCRTAHDLDPQFPLP